MELLIDAFRCYFFFPSMQLFLTIFCLLFECLRRVYAFGLMYHVKKQFYLDVMQKNTMKYSSTQVVRIDSQKIQVAMSRGE
jgi:hypothetical protein